MLRILMVLEDYGELMFLQTVLKKMGFDVDAIQNPRSFNDSVLRMNPDVLVMTAHGKKVNGIELAKGIKRVRGIPHVILIAAIGAVKNDDQMVWLDSPVGAMDLLNTIADVGNLDKAGLADKFSKLHLQEGVSEARILRLDENQAEEDMLRGLDNAGNFGTIQATSITPEERKERYKKFLSEERPPQIGFGVKEVQEHIKSLRKDESEEELAELERERKAFVEHLFRKKS
jgi:PleD family two-component response regulator